MIGGLFKINLTCYTIGHSKHKLEQFAELLKHHDINFVIDVRSIPYSRYAPQFNITSIRNSLAAFGLEYEYMGDVIGGKFSDSIFLNEDGSLDFYKVVKNGSFQNAIDIIIDKIKSGLNMVLMCAEKEPLYCHRFLIISRELNNKKIRLIHLLADGSSIGNDELVNNIIQNNKNFDFMQMELFTNNKKTYDDMVYESLMIKKMKMNHH